MICCVLLFIETSFGGDSGNIYSGMSELEVLRRCIVLGALLELALDFFSVIDRCGVRTVLPLSQREVLSLVFGRRDRDFVAQVGVSRISIVLDR